MSKLGYLSILLGILIIVVYGIYTMLLDLSIPIPIKIALLTIVGGIIIIIINLIIQRRREKIEEDDSSEY